MTRRVLNRFVDTHNLSTRIRYARSPAPRLYRYALATTGNSPVVCPRRDAERSLVVALFSSFSTLLAFFFLFLYILFCSVDSGLTEIIILIGCDSSSSVTHVKRRCL